ncbi:MAG: hypothetical protein DYG91_12855 [Chloroflexi bacterium CFX7]|nr:hypothetical protein [Chloroflexi bacterium CFX7]
MNSLLLRLTVFVAGMSVMGVELAASRLLAPYFGTSLVVWTCLIGIIMVALAFGYAAGGRRADRHPDAGSFYRTVLAAGVLTLAIPTISGPLLSATLATPMLGAILGAFLAVALLFALPVALMGMVTPYAIRLSAGPPEDAGRAAGSIAAPSRNTSWRRVRCFCQASSAARYSEAVAASACGIEPPARYRPGVARAGVDPLPEYGVPGSA